MVIYKFKHATILKSTIKVCPKPEIRILLSCNIHSIYSFPNKTSDIDKIYSKLTKYTLALRSHYLRGLSLGNLKLQRSSTVEFIVLPFLNFIKFMK